MYKPITLPRSSRLWASRTSAPPAISTHTFRYRSIVQHAIVYAIYAYRVQTKNSGRAGERTDGRTESRLHCSALISASLQVWFFDTVIRRAVYELKFDRPASAQRGTPQYDHNYLHTL